MLSFQQLLLPLAYHDRYQGELVYGNGNADVTDWLSQGAHWPLQQLFIQGPEKSGKTTLSRITARDLDSTLLSLERLPIVSELPLSPVIVDDADTYPQEFLFHLYNEQKQRKQFLIFLSHLPLHEWCFDTEDLASRMKTFYPLQILHPNDAMAEQLLFKFLKGRGIDADQAALSYLLLRTERTYQTLHTLASNLDLFLLNKKNKLTVVQAREFLAQTLFQQNAKP